MPRLGTKPALALGVTAAMVMGASGVSAAREAPAAGTTPNVRQGHGGPGLGADATALAKKLGVSVADLQAAVKAVRDSETKPDRDAERATQAKTIADELGVEASTITKALEAQEPAKGDRPNGTPPAGGPKGATPPTGAPSGTTPPDRPAGTTPPAGGRPGGPGGPGGRGHGGPGGGGPRASADDTALVAALVKSTGKTEAEVKAALKKADAVREAAQKARAAEFAKKLADKLGLDESKVATAIEAARVTPPARNAKEGTSQTK